MNNSQISNCARENVRKIDNLLEILRDMYVSEEFPPMLPVIERLEEARRLTERVRLVADIKMLEEQLKTL